MHCYYSNSFIYEWILLSCFQLSVAAVRVGVPNFYLRIFSLGCTIKYKQSDGRLPSSILGLILCRFAYTVLLSYVWRMVMKKKNTLNRAYIIYPVRNTEKRALNTQKYRVMWWISLNTQTTLAEYLVLITIVVNSWDRISNICWKILPMHFLLTMISYSEVSTFSKRHQCILYLDANGQWQTA